MNFNEGLYSMRNSVLNTSSMSLASQQGGGWFVLCVGGEKEFRVMKASLRREPNSILAQLVDDQIDPEQLTDQYGNVTYDHCSGRWQIDADADYFEYIIKYLRTGKFNDVRPGHTLQGFLPSFPANQILDLSDEAEALKLDRLVEICQQKILERQNQQQQFMRSGMSTPSGSSANYFYPNYPQGFFPPPGIHPLAPKMAMGPPPGFGFESPRTDQSPSESTRSSQQMLPHQLREQFQPPPIATSTPEDKTGPPQPQLEDKVQQQQQLTNGLPAFSEEPPSLSTNNFDDESLGQFAIPARRPLNLNPLAETVMEEEYGLEEEGVENCGLEEYDGNGNMEREENYGQNGTANNNWMGNADMWAESDEYATEALQQQNREENYNGRSQSPQFGDYPDQLPLNSSYPDISSTIFIAPVIDANYRPLIDIETVTPTKMPVFEIQDGLLKNFKKIEKIRSNFIEDFLYTLKEQNNLSEYRQIWRDKLGAVVFYLQRFYVRYPEGSTIDEFCAYEHEMKLDRDGHYDLVPTIPSLLDANNPDALMTMDGEEIITVTPEVLTVHLFCIRQNLCTNLFRFLLRNPRKQGKDLLEEMKKLVPAGAPPPSAEDLLSILNRYPAVFTLFFLEEQTNYTLEAGWIKLNEMLTKDEDLKWRIVLDCDVACMGVEFCDCGNCPDGL